MARRQYSSAYVGWLIRTYAPRDDVKQAYAAHLRVEAAGAEGMVFGRFAMTGDRPAGLRSFQELDAVLEHDHLGYDPDDDWRVNG